MAYLKRIWIDRWFSSGNNLRDPGRSGHSKLSAKLGEIHCFDLHRKYPAACPHAVGLNASSTGTRLLSLSTIVDAKIINPPWVNFQSAGSIRRRRQHLSFQALQLFYEFRHDRMRRQCVHYDAGERQTKDDRADYQSHHCCWYAGVYL